MMKIKMEHLTFCGMNHTILKELTSNFFCKCNRKKEEQQRWKFCNHSSSASKFTKWWLISLPCINMLLATKWALGCKIYRCQTTDCIKKDGHRQHGNPLLVHYCFEVSRLAFGCCYFGGFFGSQEWPEGEVIIFPPRER